MGTMLALLLVLSTLSGCARETLTDLKNALPEPAPREIFYQLDYSSYEESFLDYKGNTLAYCDYTAPQMSALREDGSQILEAQNPEEEQQHVDVAPRTIRIYCSKQIEGAECCNRNQYVRSAF